MKYIIINIHAIVAFTIIFTFIQHLPLNGSKSLRWAKAALPLNFP